MGCQTYTHLIPYCVTNVSNTGLNEMPAEIESYGEILIVTYDLLFNSILKRKNFPQEQLDLATPLGHLSCIYTPQCP